MIISQLDQTHAWACRTSRSAC